MARWLLPEYLPHIAMGFLLRCFWVNQINTQPGTAKMPRSIPSSYSSVTGCGPVAFHSPTDPGLALEAYDSNILAPHTYFLLKVQGEETF